MKSAAVIEELEGMKLPRAAQFVREGVAETLRYMAFRREHWRCIKTNNPLERLNREVRRRTRVVGAFSDGQSGSGLRLRPTTAGEQIFKSFLGRCSLAMCKLTDASPA